MANPVNVSVPHKTVTKIATNVNSADIIIKQGAKRYFQTYVLTGSAAPSAPSDTDNPDLDFTGLWAEMADQVNNFRPSAASDLYLWCTGSEASVPGRVRVDV